MIFNFYAQIMPRRFLVDTTYVLRIFIHVELVSEFVVVAILFERWLVPITADQCGSIPELLPSNSAITYFLMTALLG